MPPSHGGSQGFESLIAHQSCYTDGISFSVFFLERDYIIAQKMLIYHIVSFEQEDKLIKTKRLYIVYIALLLCFLSLAVSSCKPKDTEGDDFLNTGEDLSSYFDISLPTGSLEFTHSILNPEHFDRIIPLGNMNPPGHAFPTDHIYFVLTIQGVEVYAPAGGKVLYIDEPSAYGDRAIRVGVTSTMAYYLGHIFINESIKVGDSIEAGAQIGTSGNTACVDFGVVNKNINNAFINQKYPATTLYGDKPLSYYTEPLRSELYSLVRPVQAIGNPDFVYDEGVTDGEFMLDLIGTLSGNWFEEGCFSEGGWYEWEDTLAFGYDIYYPEQIRIAIGKDITYQNLAINNNDSPVRPENVTIESGVVAYYLYNANNSGAYGLPTGERIGLMMVQMLSDTRIKLEIFFDTTSETREFTSAALYYIR